MCQLEHKILPPHNEFIQLKPNTCLKQTHYLDKLEDDLPTQKNDSHPILVVCGDDQITHCFQDRGNTATYTPLVFFSTCISLFIQI